MPFLIWYRPFKDYQYWFCIRSSKRRNLSYESLEAIMRIQFNLNESIETFATSKYVKEWLDADHMRADDVPLNPSKKPRLSYDDDDPNEKRYLSGSTIF